jgi:DNA-binding transcriptional LysR family regulator
MDKHADMATFVHVVDDGGFSSAARALNRTPSAISKQIGRLEDRLGVSLLRRTTRRLRLTEAGEIYYYRARRILTEVEDAERAASEMQDAVRGTLRLTTSAALGESQMVPLMADLHDLYPDLRVELIMTDRMVDLVAEGFDVAIRVAPQLQDSSVIVRRIAANRRVICAAPTYIERHGTPQSPQDLHRHNCLTFAWQTNLNDWHFVTPDGPVTIRVTGSFEANNGLVLYQAAQRGLGIVMVSSFLVADDIRAGRMVPLLGEYDDHAESNIYAVYPPGRHLSPNIRAFIDFLVERYSPAPPWEDAIP